MSRIRDYLVPPQRGPFADMSAAELAEFDARISGADLMSEAETGLHASKATLAAGQAAANAVKARRGKS